jgi:capsule polysaccharide export protein KpsE/RkpR
MTDAELLEIERRASILSPYGDENKPQIQGLQADVRALIAEVRRARISAEQPPLIAHPDIQRAVKLKRLL